MRRKIVMVLLVCSFFTALYGCLGSGSDFGTRQVIVQSEPDEPAAPVLSQLYDVVRVCDGDTIVVAMGGDIGDIRVRLIGIDTPESVNPNKELNCKNGEIASDYMKSLLPDGSKVYLEYDEQQYDEYGRILAYVYLDDGETMLEDLLLEAGMAETMDIPPNSKYADVFSALESGARDTDTGFWLENKFNLIDLY